MSQNISKFFEGFENTDFYQRLLTCVENEGLSTRIKILTLIAGAQAAGKFDLISCLIKWAVNSGISIQAIYEILLQGHLFVGYPKGLESFFVLNDTAKELGISLSDELSSPENWDQEKFKDRGFDTARKIYSKNFDLVHKNIDCLAPELAMGMIYEGYGRIISRPGVDLMTRELAIVSSLTVSQMPRQLYSHVRGAYNVGASSDIIKQVITLCGVYCGEEIIAKALETMEKSLGNFPYPK